MAIQTQGFSGVVDEVESTTRARRITARPIDYGSLGIYSLGGQSGTMAAGLAANAPIYSFRWGDATRLCLLRSVRIGGGSIVAFTAGFGKFDLMLARAFTASDSGQTSLLPTGNFNKRRTSMGTTLVTDVRISNTAAITAGTRTLDGQPAGIIAFGVPASAGALLGSSAGELLPDDRDCRHPVVFAQNEGFIIRATVPATGTWTFGVSLDWEEVAAF